MVVKIAGLGRSFAGVAAYCLHDRREPGEPQPESAERVEWTETRNLPTSRGDRAAAIMAATAEAAPELKRLAGASAVGRRLEKPVCHYSLSWAKDQYEVTDRQEMQRAVAESLTTLGLETHQALIVAHGDGHPHVHVIVNRVDPESGKAATLSRSKLRLANNARARSRGAGEGPGLRLNGETQAGADESAPGAEAEVRGWPSWEGAGAGGLAAGGGARALDPARARARGGTQESRALDQAGVGGSLRASRPTAEAVGEGRPPRPRGVGPLAARAASGEGVSRECRGGDREPQGAPALGCGAGAEAPV